MSRFSTLSLFRAFFPSWRFFERSDRLHRLAIRFGASPDALGPWERIPRPGWRPGSLSLLLNPTGNLRMALQSLVDRLMGEIHDGLDESTTYLLVRRYARLEALERCSQSPGLAAPGHFQFRITEEAEGTSEIVLLSPIEPLEKV